MATKPGAPAARLLGRAALVLFLVLLVFGLTLLFAPDLANELDERSGGGDSEAISGVAVTETKRTVEEATETSRDSTSNKRSGGGSNKANNRRGRGGNDGGGGGGRSTQSTQSQSTTETTTTDTTTTTETITPPVEEESAFEETFLVPALAVLLRCAVVALIAALAATPLLWAMRRTRNSGETDRATSNPHPPGPPAPATSTSNDNPKPKAERPPPPPLPVKPAVTRADAEAAKTRILAGIPLLREIFEERGEPTIANTLPDMRVKVRLTDTITKEQPLPVSILAEDPALALLSFRTEVEQRLRRLARDAVAQSTDSTDDILRGLTDEGLLEPEATEGFRNLLRMSDRTLRGARIDPAMGAWVREDGVSLLLSLDLMLPS